MIINKTILKKYIWIHVPFFMFFFVFSSLIPAAANSGSKMIDYPGGGGYTHRYDCGDFSLQNEHDFDIISANHYVLALADCTPKTNQVSLIYTNISPSEFSNGVYIANTVDPNTMQAYVEVQYTWSGTIISGSHFSYLNNNNWDF